MRPSRTALVVDPVRHLRDGVDAVLRASGASSLLAPDLKGALRAFSGADPDAVFLSTHLSEGTLATCFSQAVQVWSASPLIAMRGLDGPAGDALLLDAKAHGADLMLREPGSRKAIEQSFEDATSLKSSGARRPRALVVDDSSTVRKIVRKYLETARWRVFEAPDMESALRELTLVDADVVVTDIFMPGIGGIEGIRQLRERWPDLGIVAASGGLDARMQADGALAAAARIGADRVVVKPFSAETLLEAARAACRAPVTRWSSAA